MYTYDLAYRFKGERRGGEYTEEFTATAANRDLAYFAARKKVERKCKFLCEEFDPKRLVFTNNHLAR